MARYPTFGRPAFTVAASLVFAGILASAALGKSSEIVLGMLPVVDNLPFHVAETEGLFRKVGVDVRLLPFASAMERDAAMRSGAIDGCLGDVVMAALMEATGCDISVISIGLGEKADEGRFALLAAPGSSVKTIRDLRSAEVGISENTVIEFVADELLESGGVKPGDVKKMDVPKLPVRTEMLLNGTIRAAVLPDPMATYAQARGARLIADDTGSNITQTVITFRVESLKVNGPAVKALLKAYGEASTMINSDPGKYRELLAETGKVPENIKKAYRMDHYPQPQLPLKGDIDRVVKWMVQKGMLKETVQYRDLVDGTYLPKVQRKP